MTSQQTNASLIIRMPRWPVVMLVYRCQILYMPLSLIYHHPARSWTSSQLPVTMRVQLVHLQARASLVHRFAGYVRLQTFLEVDGADDAVDNRD